MLKNMAVENDEVSKISVTVVWLRRQCHFFSSVYLKPFNSQAAMHMAGARTPPL
jgi:hypothetical protein